MPAERGGAGFPAIVLLCGIPFLIYRVTSISAPDWLIFATVIVQATAAAWFFARKLPLLPQAAIVVATTCLIAGTTFFTDVPARLVGLVVSGFCHATAYLLLLIWFASRYVRGGSLLSPALPAECGKPCPTR